MCTCITVICRVQRLLRYGHSYNKQEQQHILHKQLQLCFVVRVVAIKNVNSERERLRGNVAAADEDDDSDANAGFGCAGNAFGYQTLNNRDESATQISLGSFYTSIKAFLEHQRDFKYCIA